MFASNIKVKDLKALNRVMRVMLNFVNKKRLNLAIFVFVYTLYIHKDIKYEKR